MGAQNSPFSTRKWQEEGLPNMTAAIHVSAVQFRQEGFCELIGSVLHEADLAAQCLVLEVTESLLQPMQMWRPQCFGN